MPYLAERGHDMIPLIRNTSMPGIYWDPDAHYIDKASLNGIDALIHLAGESVAERWTADKKRRIYDSRVTGTRLLADAVSSLEKRPTDFISASAIGYYGDRGSEVLTEESEPGRTFLARVCVEWEAAASQVSFAGIRASSMRLGIVLSTRGGAFPKMLAPFEVGAGGKLSNGKQFMSWIVLSDTLRAIDFILQNRQLAGPVNVVSANPITNAEFTDTLGLVLRKPTLVHVPAAMAYMAYGTEMADEVLLASDRVLPERLASAGFQFEFSKIEQALEKVVLHRA
jgi:uncharacterized protein (TIGR01777 family)